MSLKRIALYVLLLSAAAYWWREPLVAFLYERVEARELAQREEERGKASAAMAAWSVAYALRAADTDEPRQRVVAATILHGARRENARRSQDGAKPVHAESDLVVYEARADALVRELLAGSDDEFALWLIVMACPASPAACDRPRALRRLREVAGDNASVQLAALSLAPDAAARREALAAGARAKRDSLYWMVAADAAVAAQSHVPMPPEVIESEGAGEEGLALIAAGFGFAMALPTPGLSTFIEGCKPEALPADDPAWRDDCIAFARVLVRAEDTLLNYRIGLRVLRRLLVGTAEEAAIVERIRQAEWLTSRYKEVPAADYTDAATVAQWVADWRAGGELHSIREKYRRYGIPTEAPAGWMPERPETLDP